MATKPEIIFDEATHTYLVDGQEVPSVTTILKPLSDRGYGKISQSVLQYAANRGRAVHEALEVYDLGGELEVTPETQGYIQAYLEWSEIYRPKWIGVEQIVYCESEGYIGTLDRIGTLNGTELAIVDIKTSQPTKEALVSVCLQTTAYELAYCRSLMADYEIPTINRYGLFLNKDGTYRCVNCREYEIKYAFFSYDSWHKLLDTYKMITKILETKARGK